MSIIVGAATRLCVAGITGREGTFHKAVAETGANTAMVFVPPRFAADSILEAAEAGGDGTQPR